MLRDSFHPGISTHEMNLDSVGRMIRIKVGFSSSKEDFGMNQLPGGSMGLSPLNPAWTSDLHVSTESRTSIGVSPDFVRARNRSPPFGS